MIYFQCFCQTSQVMHAFFHAYIPGAIGNTFSSHKKCHDNQWRCSIDKCPTSVFTFGLSIGGFTERCKISSWKWLLSLLQLSSSHPCPCHILSHFKLDFLYFEVGLLFRYSFNVVLNFCSLLVGYANCFFAASLLCIMIVFSVVHFLLHCCIYWLIVVYSFPWCLWNLSALLLQMLHY